MSTTTPTVHHPLPGEVHGRAPREVGVRERSLLDRIIHTDTRVELTVARLGLGLVMLPHALQKLFGWFGGGGLAGTHAGFVNHVGLSPVIAAIAMALEILGTFGLILGLFTRAAALAIIGVMLGAIFTVHLPNGFFMNFSGKQAGEGFEYHLLAIALGLVCLIAGGGRVSVDRAIEDRRHPPLAA